MQGLLLAALPLGRLLLLEPLQPLGGRYITAHGSCAVMWTREAWPQAADGKGCASRRRRLALTLLEAAAARKRCLPAA